MQWYNSARLALKDRLDAAVQDGAQSVLEKSTLSGGTDTDITLRKHEDQVSGLPG